MPKKIPPEYSNIKKMEIRWSAIVQIVRIIVVCGTIAFLGHCVRMATESLAGQETSANFILKLLSKNEVAATITLVVPATLLWLLLRERKLRRDIIQRFNGLSEELERQKDPRRSTSNLDKRGDTRPEDRQ